MRGRLGPHIAHVLKSAPREPRRKCAGRSRQGRRTARWPHDSLRVGHRGCSGHRIHCARTPTPNSGRRPNTIVRTEIWPLRSKLSTYNGTEARAIRCASASGLVRWCRSPNTVRAKFHLCSGRALCACFSASPCCRSSASAGRTRPSTMAWRLTRQFGWVRSAACGSSRAPRRSSSRGTAARCVRFSTRTIGLMSYPPPAGANRDIASITHRSDGRRVHAERPFAAPGPEGWTVGVDAGAALRRLPALASGAATTPGCGRQRGLLLPHRA